MEGEKTNGALIGSVVIIVILILGGVFLWRAKMNQPQPEPEQNYADIEADLNQMELDNLDEGI